MTCGWGVPFHTTSDLESGKNLPKNTHLDRRELMPLATGCP